MKKFEFLNTHLEDGILTITLTNLENLNALTEPSIQELQEAIQTIYDNPEIKSAIITGAGEEVFATSIDAKEMLKLNELNGRKFAEVGQETLASIENCHKPILAAINGCALGGGFALALACHFRIASENATLAFPEVSLGTIPGFGATQRLTYLIGKAKTLEIMMTGKTLTAEEAKEIGLVSHVISYKEEMIKKSKALLKTIIAHAPLAVGMLVSCTNAACNPHENGYQTEANCFAHCCKTADFQEGITALLEKRIPKFKGQ